MSARWTQVAGVLFISPPHLVFLREFLSFGAITSFLSLMLIFILIFALLGMSFFGGKFQEIEVSRAYIFQPLNNCANFYSDDPHACVGAALQERHAEKQFWQFRLVLSHRVPGPLKCPSCLISPWFALFIWQSCDVCAIFLSQVVSGENWNDVLYNMMEIQPILGAVYMVFLLDIHESVRDSNAATHCSTEYLGPAFISFCSLNLSFFFALICVQIVMYIFCNWCCLNLFLAILLERFGVFSCATLGHVCLCQNMCKHAGASQENYKEEHEAKLLAKKGLIGSRASLVFWYLLLHLKGGCVRLFVWPA